MTYTTISGANVKRDPSNRGKWWVSHPANGAILAYCDTQEEANAVVGLFNAVDTLLHMSHVASKCRSL
jgi:hypothetical protein